MKSDDHFKPVLPSMNRRQVLLQTARYWLMGGNLRCVVRVLTDPWFLDQKIALGSPHQLAEEWHEAYHRLDASRRKRLVRAVASLVMDHEERPDGRFRLEDLTSCFAYRRDREFYREVLARVEEECPANPWGRTIAVKALRELSGLLRREQQTEEAHQRLRRLLDLLKRERPPNYKLIGAVEYEIGMTHYLLGRARRSLGMLDQAAANSHRGSDAIGELISRSRKVVTALFCGLIRPEDAVQQLKDLRLAFMNTADAHPAIPRWIRNITAHLCDAAYEAGEEQSLATFLDQLKHDPITIQMQHEPEAQTFVLARDARLAMLNKDWGRAASCFAGYLETDLTPWGNRREDLVSEMKRREAFSREYLHAGMVLTKLGESEKARQAWRKGLQCPDNMGNQRWKRLIASKLK